MKKVKIVYQDSDGFAAEIIIEVNEKDLDSIGQCFRNIYGWTVEE